MFGWIPVGFFSIFSILLLFCFFPFILSLSLKESIQFFCLSFHIPSSLSMTHNWCLSCCMFLFNLRYYRIALYRKRHSIETHHSYSLPFKHLFQLVVIQWSFFIYLRFLYWFWWGFSCRRPSFILFCCCFNRFCLYWRIFTWRWPYFVYLWLWFLNYWWFWMLDRFLFERPSIIFLYFRNFNYRFWILLRCIWWRRPYCFRFYCWRRVFLFWAVFHSILTYCFPYCLRSTWLNYTWRLYFASLAVITCSIYCIYSGRSRKNWFRLYNLRGWRWRCAFGNFNRFGLRDTWSWILRQVLEKLHPIFDAHVLMWVIKIMI